jgi:hypothetical protein
MFCIAPPYSAAHSYRLPNRIIGNPASEVWSDYDDRGFSAMNQES